MKYLAIILIAFTACSAPIDGDLAKIHKQYCTHHKGRSYSVHKDDQWQIFCNDGFIVIVEDN